MANEPPIEGRHRAAVRHPSIDRASVRDKINLVDRDAREL